MKTFNYAVDDIVPYDNSKETSDFNFQREDKDRIIPELGLHLTEQQTDTISYDYLKLKFPLIHANEANFNVNSHLFFRSGTPHIPTQRHETMAMLYSESYPYRQMTPTEEEQELLNSGTYEDQIYRRAKLRFPNAKPFFDTHNHRLGVAHFYFKNGEFIVNISGKIASGRGVLGLINNNTIDQSLDVLKSTGLVNFNNNAFKNRAEVLSVHITNDLKVPNINTAVKAFSSFLPMRTDKYNVLKYGNNGYEILARGKQSKQTPNYEFCIYNKGAEIKEKHYEKYRTRIGESGIELAGNTIRMELRLKNFPAIRKFLAPDLEKGTLTLAELLACKQTPIIEMLKLLNITSEKLKEARGKYITMVENEEYPTQAEFERMHGLIRLLELNDYSLDKVRSYIEVETNRKTHSTYFKEKRDILQRYITCYMPQTVATLAEILEAMSY